jgi:hypothetical protein
LDGSSSRRDAILWPFHLLAAHKYRRPQLNRLQLSAEAVAIAYVRAEIGRAGSGREVLGVEE